MPLDPRAQRLLTMMAAGSPATRQRSSADERRQSLAKLMQFARADLDRVTTVDGTLPGPVSQLCYRLYTPADRVDEPLPGFVFFHGGGMVAGSIETHHRFSAALALAIGCRLISIDYRLAPEHKFPAAIEDAIAATAFIWRNAASLGIDARRLVVGGDSAGAALAAVVCQQARQTADVSIAAQCLICPVLDFADASASRAAFAEGYLIDRTTLQSDLSDYLPAGADLADPRISPLRAADVAGLPPAIIHTAEFDPMRDEGNAYAQRLTSAGVAVAHVCHDGMVHNFHAMGALLPQAQAALTQLGEQVRQLQGIPPMN
ncbi:MULTISPECIES: alpha/beta hydrolase [unclassified Bradyrhizobium]|uniref:alpha/beta hydrolase n=1 Tax=unclassified Bradyrhizobium TaxID=2631580 RepID=UPI0028EE8139|nr:MULTISPECIES: alpha/beta hydrolase [unclassified Bradyrhizobium]